MIFYKMESSAEIKINELPIDVLSHIFSYCVNDIKDFNSIRQVCKSFQRAISLTSFKEVRIVDTTPSEHIIPVLKFSKSIQSLVIKDFKTDNINEILSQLKYVEGLKKFELKGVVLNLNSVRHITSMLRKSKKLRVFKIVGGIESIPKDDWLYAFRRLSKLTEVEELTFTEPLPSKWNAEKFIIKHAKTLKSLKIEMKEKIMSSRCINRCTNLNTLRFYSDKMHPYFSAVYELLVVLKIQSISIRLKLTKQVIHVKLGLMLWQQV